MYILKVYIHDFKYELSIIADLGIGSYLLKILILDFCLDLMKINRIVINDFYNNVMLPENPKDSLRWFAYFM